MVLMMILRWPKSMDLVDVREIQHHEQGPIPSIVSSECHSPVKSRADLSQVSDVPLRASIAAVDVHLRTIAFRQLPSSGFGLFATGVSHLGSSPGRDMRMWASA